MWRRERIAVAHRNAGHRVIRRQRSRAAALLTQNVDALHARAGGDEIELHGSLWRLGCASGCDYLGRDEASAPPRAELHCPRGAWLRPDIMWLGEALDPQVLNAATGAAERADPVLVNDTSAPASYPAAALAPVVRRRQARLVEINVEDTELSPHADAALRAPAREILPALEAVL